MFNPPTKRSVFLLPFLLFAFVNQAHAEAAKPAITEAEVMQLVNKGEELKGRTVNADLIVKAFTRGKQVRINECVIEGDVIFRDGQASFFRVTDTVVNGRIEFTGTTFTGQLTFSGNTTFRSEVVFDKVTFKDLFTVDGEVVFQKGFVAYLCNFFDQVRFDNVTFNEFASFNESTFKGPTSFVATKAFGRFLFHKAVFLDQADLEIVFSGETAFDEATFNGVVYFSDAEFRGERVVFAGAKFHQRAYFSHVKILGSVSFAEASFLGDVHFDKINRDREPLSARPVTEPLLSGKLLLSSTRFHGRAYFDDSQLQVLSLSNQGSTERYGSPTVFEKRLIGRNLICQVADFSEVEFRDYVDLSNAWFTHGVVFTGARFAGEVDFYRTRFPPLAASKVDEPNGIAFEKVKFEKMVHLHYSQLYETLPWWQVWSSPKTKVINHDTTTWEMLERTFSTAGKTEGKNEALYNKRSIAPYSDGPERESRVTNFLERSFWGYGVRPWRLFLWILFLFGVFTAVYFTQTRPLKDIVERLKFALDFSWRTSLTLGYGYQQSRTTFFKTLTLIHSIVFKIMLLCLLKAVANVSPLLNDLLGKLLPT